MKKKPFKCATAVALTFLLQDPISAEIRTVDSQSDLRICTVMINKDMTASYKGGRGSRRQFQTNHFIL